MAAAGGGGGGSSGAGGHGGGGGGGPEAVEDVDRLMFGAGSSDIGFLSNSAVALLLATVSEKHKAGHRPTEVFTRARLYVNQFRGAVALTDGVSIDKLYNDLRYMTFVREADDGEAVTHRLHEYQVRWAKLGGSSFAPCVCRW